MKDDDLINRQEAIDAAQEYREFIKLTVRNSNGRPYYSIIYLEVDDNGVVHDFEGYSSYSLNVISDYLKKFFMPSAQQWISVTERLPIGRDWVLGVFKEQDTGWVNPIPFVCEYVGKGTAITTDDFWILKEHEDKQEFGFDYYRNLQCVAWMPLPESYKEGE